MTYSSDRSPLPGFARGQVSPSTVPNANVTDKNFAVPCQRTVAPTGFKGVVDAPWIPLAELGVKQFVGLSLTKAIALPLEIDSLFYCSDNSVIWDESDLPLITGKTPAQIVAAPLKSKIAVIGDATQTFELAGARSPGPLIFRWAGSALWLIKNLDVWRVLPMLMQPISAATTGVGQSPAIITGNSPIAVKPFDRVVLGGTGEITLSGFTVTGDWLEIRWKGTHVVTIKCPATYKIGGFSDDLTLDTALMATSGLVLTLDAATKNFLVT
jgi:hypothetical protein